MTSSLKQELLNKINASEDENLLALLNTEYNLFTHKNKADVTDNLSLEDFEELSNLMKEPFGHETVSLEDYKKATDRWRTK
jgi:hypothetical protein